MEPTEPLHLPMIFAQDNFEFMQSVGSYDYNRAGTEEYYPQVVQDNAAPKRRVQVKRACVNCQSACKKCDEQRPCQRCTKFELADQCVDSIRKERARGLKRGPYKRKNGQDTANAPQSVILKKKSRKDTDLLFALSKICADVLDDDVPETRKVSQSEADKLVMPTPPREAKQEEAHAHADVDAFLSLDNETDAIPGRHLITPPIGE